MLDLILPAREIVKATPRTRVIHADLGSHDFAFHAGQAVFAGLAESGVRRPYSIACSPAQAREGNSLELLVQIDDHEAPDPHLERVGVGTLLHIQGPFGQFALPEPLGDELLLIAGGTGIAPLRSMMWDALERNVDTHISVIYSARTPDEFAYRDELPQLAADGRIELLMTITRDINAHTWTGVRGRVNEGLMRQVLKSTDARAVVCGPAALVADTTALLHALGVPPAHIATETYSS